MRRVVLFIAMSLDGYIADENGKVEWLNGHDCERENPDTYSTFVQEVDTVVMGWNTYHQIATELSPEKWVYEGLTSYVVTHKSLPASNHVLFTTKNPCDLVKELREQQGKNVWICGGAEVIQQLVQANLIDEYYISVIPTILGGGIRLFGTSPEEIRLKLIRTQTYNGITELVYIQRENR